MSAAEVRHDRGCPAGVAPDARCTCLAPEVWVRIGYLPPLAEADPPVRRMFLAELRRQGEEQAAEAGVRLLGEPSGTEQPTVTVAGWSEPGVPEWVRPEAARLVGLDPDTLKPGPTIVRFEWQIDTAPAGR